MRHEITAFGLCLVSPPIPAWLHYSFLIVAPTHNTITIIVLTDDVPQSHKWFHTQHTFSYRSCTVNVISTWHLYRLDAVLRYCSSSKFAHFLALLFYTLTLHISFHFPLLAVSLPRDIYCQIDYVIFVKVSSYNSLNSFCNFSFTICYKFYLTFDVCSSLTWIFIWS